VTESEVYVVARTTGQILEVLVERGDRVVQGQVLAEFENREEELVLRAREAELELAQTVESNRRKLGKIVSEELLLEAQTELKLAQARVDLARFRFEDTKVRAPLAGVILDRMAREGMYILESDTVPLFRLAGEGPLEIRAYLPEWALPYLGEGDQVTLRPVFGSQPLEGRVHWLSPVVDPVAGTVEARVRLAGDSSPRQGAAVELEFVLLSDPELPSVPRESLVGPEIRPGETAEILVSSQGRGWERRAVRLGLVGPDRVEIRSGLDFGDRVHTAALPAKAAAGD
jgi:HlyD family secretion protein